MPYSGSSEDTDTTGPSYKSSISNLDNIHFNSGAASKMKLFYLLTLVAFSATEGRVVQLFGQQPGTGYNNSCLWEKPGLNRDGPQEFDCPRFVIESTDQVWSKTNFFQFAFL